MTGWPLWLLIGGLGSLTYVSRVAFFLRPPTLSEPPADPVPALNQASVAAEPRLLRYVFPAMLSALVISALLGGPETPGLAAHALAGLGALAIALWAAKSPTWHKATVLVTLASGLGTLWLLGAVGW